MGQRVDFAMIKSSPDFISGYDEQLNVVVWNDAIAKKYNTPRERAIGKNLMDLFPRLKKDDFRVQCLQQSIRERQTYFFSYLPYAFEPGTYTQLILPTHSPTGSIALNIVRDHCNNERFLQRDLLKHITTN